MTSRSPLRWLLALPLLAGCVDVSHPGYGSILVEVRTPEGEAIRGARVEMRGGWNYPTNRAIDYTDGGGFVRFYLPGGAGYDMTVYVPDDRYTPRKSPVIEAGILEGQSRSFQVFFNRAPQ